MKFLEMFKPIQKGNFGLTDEAIYKSIQQGGNFVPVWGGEQSHVEKNRLVSENGKTKYSEPITIFKGEGVIISLDGSAGCMTYVRDGRFALNHHAGFFKVKDNNLIDPEFFSLFYESQLREAGVSEGSKTLSLKKIYSVDFAVPDYPIQKRIMSSVRKLLATKEKLEKMISNLNIMKQKALSSEYGSFQAKAVPLSGILDCLSGNSGLIEEVIYQKSQYDGLRYTVLSSSTTEETRLGETPMCYLNNKPLKVFEDKEGILVIRNGKAGTTFFLEKGKYTINDHAYILSLKENFRHEVILKWLMVQYQKDFFEYSSSSDNGTWNKTGFFRDMKVDLPSIDEQKKVLKVYEKLELLEKKINNLKNRIESLFIKQISVV